MTTKLYNTQTQQIIYTSYNGYYTVDGVRPTLPENIIELVVVDTPAPNYNTITEKLSWTWVVDSIALEYRKEWVIENKTPYEIAMEDWRYPQYLKRIIAPKELLFDDIGIKMYGWFQLNKLPVELIDTNIYLWCNEILDEHQAIVDSLDGVIVIEDRPDSI